jgi:hypothetical protein
MKACKENGVTELQIGDFRLALGTQDREPIEPSVPVGRPTVSVEQPIKAEAIPDQSIVDQVREAEDDEADALLEDPFAFETALANGELNEEPDNRATV